MTYSQYCFVRPDLAAEVAAPPPAALLVTNEGVEFQTYFLGQSGEVLGDIVGPTKRDVTPDEELVEGWLDVPHEFDTSTACFAYVAGLVRERTGRSELQPTSGDRILQVRWVWPRPVRGE